MAADYTELRSEALTRLRNVARLAKSAGAATLAKTLEQDRIARRRLGRPAEALTGLGDRCQVADEVAGGAVGAAQGPARGELGEP